MNNKYKQQSKDSDNKQWDMEKIRDAARELREYEEKINVSSPNIETCPS